MSSSTRSLRTLAGLTYVTGDEPGIRRLRRGRGFVYRHHNGAAVRDAATLRRIRALAIPPAWINVWICALPNGHLQATGRDARGRKQYRYHADWRAARDATKFDRLAQFGKCLVDVRRRVDRALKQPGLAREKVLAAVIGLLDEAGLRIGNAEYARANGSFGLTTLQDRHLKIGGSSLKLRFPGKGGQQHEIEIRSPRLVRIVKRCSDLPGQILFQYLDEQGRPQPIGSADVNALLREWTGADFTAKSFRTWAGTVSFLRAVRESAEHPSSSLAEMVSQVAALLGNTPTVCRKFYIHPVLLERYADGTLVSWLRTAERRPTRVPRRGLDVDERLLLRWLSSPQSAPSRAAAGH
jgi:DNA topoisomerase-1